LFAWRLNWPPHVGGWTHDALTFTEITRWTLGCEHDGRPLMRLEHPPHRRLEWGPAHRFLWFRWGNRTVEGSHGRTAFSFRNRRDPVLLALSERLSRTDAARGEPFVVRPAGTRKDRMAGAYSEYRAVARYSRRRRPTRRFMDRLYRGRVAWRIRLPSWTILAVPAWFIEPWLVVPAIAGAELLWIAGLQWSWYQNRSRRAVPS